MVNYYLALLGFSLFCTFGDRSIVYCFFIPRTPLVEFSFTIIKFLALIYFTFSRSSHRISRTQFKFIVFSLCLSFSSNNIIAMHWSCRAVDWFQWPAKENKNIKCMNNYNLLVYGNWYSLSSSNVLIALNYGAGRFQRAGHIYIYEMKTEYEPCEHLVHPIFSLPNAMIKKNLHNVFCTIRYRQQRFIYYIIYGLHRIPQWIYQQHTYTHTYSYKFLFLALLFFLGPGSCVLCLPSERSTDFPSHIEINFPFKNFTLAAAAADLLPGGWPTIFQYHYVQPIFPSQHTPTTVLRFSTPPPPSLNQYRSSVSACSMNEWMDLLHRRWFSIEI